MNKKINIVLLKNLNLSNRFLFDEVMEDVQTHQNALEIIFGKEISSAFWCVWTSSIT